VVAQARVKLRAPGAPLTPERALTRSFLTSHELIGAAPVARGKALRPEKRLYAAGMPHGSERRRIADIVSTRKSGQPMELFQARLPLRLSERQVRKLRVNARRF
jgi:hypothetical protein